MKVGRSGSGISRDRAAEGVAAEVAEVVGAEEAAAPRPAAEVAVPPAAGVEEVAAARTGDPWG